ncbi:hypothetical protein [Sphingomonas melonis]|uniref:Uncharacterized protein n=1 Tax=Sphingomonas melonis TaxID=152682 RepID=A0A7Y9FLS0_9SPHN|nr:hypothetical protein [Sphingomonas melonis]NYD89212.1 hypothetical protein [Sphingomonas melonis]
MPASPKANKSTALVPVATATDERIVAALLSTAAAARLGGTGGTIEQDEATVLVSNRPYVTAGGLTINAEEIYYRRDDEASVARRLGEADKVAWLDPETQLECIMMRARNGGFLGGYVGIPPTHPLYGFDEGAIPPDLDVHGGISHAKACQHGPSVGRRLGAEAQRICHPPERSARSEAPVYATDYRVHHDAWWLGFTCDKVYDVVPRDINDPKRFLGAEIGATYRDDDYVCREVEHLARQLKAIADGAPMPARRGTPVPPLGLDPRRGA